MPRGRRGGQNVCPRVWHMRRVHRRATLLVLHKAEHEAELLDTLVRREWGARMKKVYKARKKENASKMPNYNRYDVV